MRVFGAVLIWVLVVELLLGLGFAAGYYWIGGWQMGLLVAAAVLLLMVLPWVGELQVVYDSDGDTVEAGIGWWGLVRYRRKPEQSIEVRACGIPWRKKLEEKKAEEEAEPEEPEEAKKPEKPKKRWHVGPENIGDLARAALSGLGAGNDLIWEAREVHLRVDSPTGHKTPDEIIGKTVGHRGAGPLDLHLTAGEGTRRIRARYRIGLFRALVIAVCAACQGRVWALKKARRAPEKSGEQSHEATDEDRELIEQLQEQLQEREQDKEDE